MRNKKAEEAVRKLLVKFEEIRKDKSLSHERLAEKVGIHRSTIGKPLSDRPKGKELLDILKPGDSVISLKLDRMFRSAGDAVNQLEEFKKRKIKLFLLDMGEVTGNGIAAMVFTILSAVAQFERERIAERIAESKAVAKSQGRYTGGVVPFGFDVVEDGGKKFLQENTGQMKIINEILQLREDGLSYKKIAKAVNDNHQAGLSHMGVKRVLGRF